jgi:ribosomal protein S12
MAIQKEDKKTMSLPGIKKKPGRPATGKVVSDRDRKRAQKTRDEAMVIESPPSAWSLRVCLRVLATNEKSPLSAYKIKAIRRVIELNGFEI